MRYAIPLPLSVTLLLAALLAPTQRPQAGGFEVRLPGDFIITAPPGWRLVNQTRDSAEIFVPPKGGRAPAAGSASGRSPKREPIAEAGMLITVERRRDHAEAVRRLAEIASEYPERATTLVIAGWPAIERRYRAFVPQSGQEEPGESGDDRIETTFATTAVAAAANVVRFNTMLAPGADPVRLDEALAIARGLRAPKEGPAEASRRELSDVERMTVPPRRAPAPAPSLAPTPRPSPRADLLSPRGVAEGLAVDTKPGRGELEIASNDGQHVVVATNAGYSFSDDSGGSYTSVADKPCTGVTAICDGDPSLAVGHSGAIYYGWIGGATSDTLGDGISRSTDDGHTFPFRGMAATCPGGTSGCHVADQEHIAADRNNSAAGGQDRLYNVWRENYPVHSIRISCSSDSGATWTAPGLAIGTGDFPRVSVGGDGFVYVAYESGSNLMLHKYSNCESGLTPQTGWPVTVVAGYTEVVCPVPGLDRCQIKNTLSSPKVAVDDLDPAHIYYAFATTTTTGNEDIMVYDSADGGATFPRSVRVNAAVAARRFMPWVSAYGGVAVVSWYDRRTATTANNDLTRFYIGGAAVRGPNLVALAETDLSGVDDAQCSTWPCVAGNQQNAEQCSVQPQLAGRCRSTTDPSGSGSNTPCDFSDMACPSGESCVSYGIGCTKFGDYTGNAAWAGRLFSAWASAVPPVGAAGASGSINVYSSVNPVPSDFYVRDWNDSPAVFDNGAQPSTHANFWSTSDLWNQSASAAATPDASGTVVGDPPSHAGPNFAFARVSRRAAAMPTAAAAPVTVNFLRGDYGLGAPFVPVGSQAVTFAPGDMTKVTPALSWSVPADASIHLCLAAQIEGPDGDTFTPPGVAGLAPGPADPLILADNNKAQRNLQDTVSTMDGTELIAMIRNPETVERQMWLRIKLPRGVRLSGVAGPVGGKGVEIADGSRVFVGDLAPGEARWLRLRFTSLAGVDAPTLVDVFEDTDPPANGFTILLHRDSLANVTRRNLIDFAGVLSRVAAIEGDAAAARLSQVTLQEAARASRTECGGYLAANRVAIRRIVAAHLRAARGHDPFEIKPALAALFAAADQANCNRAAAEQAALTERLNAHLSALLRARGTTDDIVHNARWQEAMFSRLGQLPSAGEIVNASARFLAEGANPSRFGGFLDSIGAALRRAADLPAAKGTRVREAYAALFDGRRRGASPGTLQKLHRDFLLEVQRLIR